MQKVTILCVGKMKEKFYIDAAAEYVKRLGRHCKLEIVELLEDILRRFREVCALFYECVAPLARRR